MSTLKINQTLLRNQNITCLLFGQRASLSTKQINKNLTLLSNDKINLDEKSSRPLTVMPAWLLAKPKHLARYSEIHLNRGCDVLQVTITPMQLLWPTNGSQVIASQVLRFLNENFTNSPLFLHGFSIGGYVWAESLVQMAAEGDKYKPLIERFVAQVWDSAADIQDIPYGFSKAVFPNNPVMQTALQKYTSYHMRAFDKVATRHYVRASQLFHTNIIRAPALFMVSDTDTVAPLSTNLAAKENWESIGMQVELKCFKNSPHVSHMYMYPKEYVATVTSFLERALSQHELFSKEKMHVLCRS